MLALDVRNWKEVNKHYAINVTRLLLHNRCNKAQHAHVSLTVHYLDNDFCFAKPHVRS